MIAILFATEAEANPFLDAIGLQPNAPGPVQVFITGMGADNALATLTGIFISNEVDVVINVGVCGSLSDQYPVGTRAVVSSSTVPDGPPVTIPVPPAPFNDLWKSLPALRLVTVPKPVFGGLERSKLAETSDLVDMEGHAIVAACVRQKTPCLLLKAVTDLAGQGDRATLHANLKQASERLAEVLVPLFGYPLAQSLKDSSVGRVSDPATPTQRVGLHQESPPSLTKRLHRFTRLEHSIFSIPLLLAGAWLGTETPPPPLLTLLWIFVAGVGARAFGMAMNRILDRDLDALNERTRQRELPSGALSLASAYAVAFAGLAAYLGGCALLGKVCLYLAPLPIIPLTVYSLLKRFTYLCHYGIGICLALAPAAGYVAVSGSLTPTPALWLLAGFAFFWISGFDIIYALQDIEADRRNKIRSIPARFGAIPAQWIAGLTHLTAALLAFALWTWANGGIAATLALGVTLVAFIAAYLPSVPLPARFFPTSAVASVACSFIVLLRDIP